MQEGNLPASLPHSEDELADFRWEHFLPEKQGDERFGLCIIPPNATISGKFTTKRAFIYGAIDGQVFAEEVTVEKGGSVKGVIFCKTLNVGGHVHADIAAENVLVRESGRLQTNLKYFWLRILPGGTVTGSLEKRTR